MKKRQNTIGSKRRKPTTVKAATVKDHFMMIESLPNAPSLKYSDGLVRIYKREEEDIGRFAVFARTLISK